MDFQQRERRRRNYNEPGHAHGLTFSCYRRFQFLKAERVCLWLAEAINDARQIHDFDLWAFVFMPEHVHLLVCPRQPVYWIEEIRKAIKEPVGRKGVSYIKQHAPHWLPKITRKRNNRPERLFWQSGGGFDRNVTEPRSLWKMIDYIHMNPVRRGLVSRTVDWKWSSARWFEGMADLPLVPDRIPPEWAYSARWNEQ